MKTLFEACKQSEKITD